MCSMQDDGDVAMNLLRQSRRHATMLGLRGRVGGVRLKYIMLLDQGATQSFIRRSLYNWLLTAIPELRFFIKRIRAPTSDAYDRVIDVQFVVAIPLTFEW